MAQSIGHSLKSVQARSWCTRAQGARFDRCGAVCVLGLRLGSQASQPSAAIPAVPRPSAGSGLQIKVLHAGTRIALRSFKAWKQGEPVAWG